MIDPNSLYPGSIEFSTRKHWTGRFPLYTAGLGVLLPTLAGLIALVVYIARGGNLTHVEWDFEIFFALLVSFCFVVPFFLMGLITSSWMLAASNQKTFRQRQFVTLGGIAGCTLTTFGFLVYILCGPIPSHIDAFEELLLDFFFKPHYVLIALLSGIVPGMMIGWAVSSLDS